MQLALDIALPQDVNFDNFCWQGQELLCQALHDESERFVYLYGKPGLGKSHILQALTTESAKPSCYLPLSEVKAYGVDALEGLDQLDLICIDDLDQIAGDSVFEETLFHLYNRVRDSGDKRLIMSASVPINQLAIALPDLRSRLQWGFVYQLIMLPDEALLPVLMAKAKEKGMNLESNVAQFLMTHFSRDMHDLMQGLDALDKASLLEKRKLTIPFIKQVLVGHD